MFAILLAIIFVLLYVYIIYKQPPYLDGVWNADRAFMASQNLRICRFYILGDKAVILMADDVSEIYDAVYTLHSKRKPMSMLSPFTGVVTYTFSIPDTVFVDMTATYVIATNQLTLVNRDQTMVLYKNSEESMNYFKQLCE